MTEGSLFFKAVQLHEWR